MPVSGEAKEVNIVVEDVLGPLVHDERVPHWSLLHYSINLNPAMRQQIAADVESFVSSSELMRINEAGETVSHCLFVFPYRSLYAFVKAFSLAILSISA